MLGALGCVRGALCAGGSNAGAVGFVVAGERDGEDCVGSVRFVAEPRSCLSPPIARALDADSSVTMHAVVATLVRAPMIDRPMNRTWLRMWVPSVPMRFTVPQSV
ncbi:MAG: hypothetical protein ACO3QC_02405 [Phycisphaerales bacterium]